MTRKVALTNRIKVGQAASRIDSHGYIKVSLDSSLHFVHRLAWLYMTSRWPCGPVDHANGVKTDNRWANLREVTASLNAQNQRKARADNTLGILGVSLDSGLYRARITVDGKTITVGYFKTPEAASAAYIAAKRKLHLTCTI